MDFYNDISPYYDRFFLPQKQKGEFFAGRFRMEQAKKILDLACGSGSLALALAEKGFDVTAVDSSDDLLTRAGGGDPANPRPAFVAGDMGALPFLPVEIFDSVVCIGNSLPHLPDINAVEEVLRCCGDVLVMGGSLYIQMMDFGIVGKKGVLSLPELRAPRIGGGDDIVLNRIYRVQLEEVVFTPVVIDGESRRTYTIPMCYLDYGMIWEILGRLGFTHAATFGDFSGNEWTKTIPSFITVGLKKSPSATR